MLDEREVGSAVLDRDYEGFGGILPTPWYAIRSGNMTFFTPAVLCYEPRRLARGDGFTLRYRVIVHPGRWDPERLRAEILRCSTASLVEPR